MQDQQELDKLKARLHAVFARHNIVRAFVFGSFARGEASRRSDLDLIVIQETEKRFLDRYEGLLREIVEVVPGRDVDLLIYTPEELAQMLDRPFIATAMKEGAVIYEPGQESLSNDSSS